MSRDNSRTHNPWEEPPRETSYEAFLRLKRLKQRARQSKSNNASSETPATNTRSGPQTRHPAASKDTNTTSPHQRPPQQRQRPLPSELPLDENSETDIPSRRYRSPSRASEMYDQDFHNEDMYETDVPLAPPPRTTGTPPRATTRVTSTREPRPRQQREYTDDYEASSRQDQRSRHTREVEWEETSRQTQRPRSKTLAQQRARPRKRGFGSVVLIGCIGVLVALGLIVSIVIIAFLRTPLGGNILSGITNKTYTQQSSQTLSISSLKLAQIKDQVGNVTINVSSNVSKPTLTTVKKVTASSNSAANTEFARIIVSAQVVGPTVNINATLPNSGNSSSGDAVDLQITLPQTYSAATNSSITFNIATINGNVNVQQIKLAASSCLQANQGNVTFNGTLDTTNGTTLIPCQDTSTNNPHPWYTFHSEVGDVDVTLPANTSITLDVSTNVGSINGTAFGLNIPVSDNSASYHGPLTNGAASPPAELTLDVGTGNIRLHKQ